MALLQLVYLSDLVDRRESVLPDIVASAVRNNQKNGITGMLLYAEGNFIQVIEGEADAVRATYARIANDPRHRNLVLLTEEAVEQRYFAQWSMGYKKLRPEELRALPRYAHLFRIGSDAQALAPKPGDALDLLKMFSQGAI